jgi:hypothetical protein
MTDNQRSQCDSGAASFMMTAVAENAVLQNVMNRLQYEVCYGRSLETGKENIHTAEFTAQAARTHCRKLIHHLEMVQHCLRTANEEKAKPARPPPSKPTLTPVA